MRLRSGAMTSPALSIVTITYRDPDGLARTLRSLEPLVNGAAAPVSFEHLVVDSSPDESRRGLVAPEGWPLTHLVVPKEGIYAALNRGLARARGEYVWFLNGGDALSRPERLGPLLAMLEADPALELICAGAELTRNGQRLYPRYPARTLAASLIGRNRLCHQSMIYRRRVFDRVGGFSESYRSAADYEHHLRCLAAQVNARCLREELVEFEMGGTSDQIRQSLRECRQVARSLRGVLPARTWVAHRVLSEVEAVRVRVVRGIGESAAGSRLKPLWHALNRRWR